MRWKKFIFTFGSGHPFIDHCQEVFAENTVGATARMVQRYGIDWECLYTEAEFIELESESKAFRISIKKRLAPILL